MNGSYYEARKGCEPVHVQADANSWQVEAINHTPHALTDVVATGRLTGTALSDNTRWNYTSRRTCRPSTLSRRHSSPRQYRSAARPGTASRHRPPAEHRRRSGTDGSAAVAADGERVLPTVYSDNYLWLMPAEFRDTDIDCATTDLGGHSPAVLVTAYGAIPTTVSA